MDATVRDSLHENPPRSRGAGAAFARPEFAAGSGPAPLAQRLEARGLQGDAADLQPGVRPRPRQRRAAHGGRGVRDGPAGLPRRRLHLRPRVRRPGRPLPRPRVPRGRRNPPAAAVEFRQAVDLQPGAGDGHVHAPVPVPGAVHPPVAGRAVQHVAAAGGGRRDGHPPAAPRPDRLLGDGPQPRPAHRPRQAPADRLRHARAGGREPPDPPRVVAHRRTRPLHGPAARSSARRWATRCW